MIFWIGGTGVGDGINVIGTIDIGGLGVDVGVFVRVGFDVCEGVGVKVAVGEYVGVAV